MFAKRSGGDVGHDVFMAWNGGGDEGAGLCHGLADGECSDEAVTYDGFGGTELACPADCWGVVAPDSKVFVGDVGEVLNDQPLQKCAGHFEVIDGDGA